MMYASGVAVPWFSIKRHIIWDKTQVKHIRRAFEFSSFQFVKNMGRGFGSIAGCHGVVISNRVE